MSAMIDRMPPDVAALPVPPHAIDAEQAVLGGLMLDPASLARVADWLSEGDFYRQDHRLIWRAVTELVRRGSPVDPVTMGDWFDAAGLADLVGGMGYLLELANATASAANIVAYAEIVLEKSRLRQIADTGARLVEQATARGADADRLASDAVRDIAALRSSRLRGALEPAAAGLRRLHADIVARHARGPGLLGQPWPWADLNAATSGMRDGVLYVVGARPSMGKSVFAIQAAVNNAVNGHRTALFSVEMTADECMGRAVAMLGRIPHAWVEQPRDDDESAELHWHHLTVATEQLMRAPLLIDETPGITIDQLMARARRAHMQDPLRLIVIDHMHDMGIDRKAEQRHELGRIAQGAKTLAKELSCPVILLAQLNRALSARADKRPTLTDLRESGEIEQKADVVLFLHREDYYDRDSYMRGVVEVIPAKGRNIRLDGGSILLHNVFSEMRMADWVGPRPVQPDEPRPTRSRGMV